jgi:hypothetical protein
MHGMPDVPATTEHLFGNLHLQIVPPSHESRGLQASKCMILGGVGSKVSCTMVRAAVHAHCVS